MFFCRILNPASVGSFSVAFVCEEGCHSRKKRQFSHHSLNFDYIIDLGRGCRGTPVARLILCQSGLPKVYHSTSVVRPIEIQFSAISAEWDLKRLFSLVLFQNCLDIEIYF